MIGDLTPGERIDIDAIATDLQVSRTPVREALLQLEREGLVDRQAYKGTVVAGVDPVRLEENVALRLQMEGLAAGLGVSQLDAYRLSEMESALVELDGHIAAREEYSLGVFNEYNRLFHSTLYAASGRESLIRLVDSLQVEADRIRLHFDVRSSGVNTEHWTILEACRAGEAATARRATQHHILNAYLRTRGMDAVPRDAEMLLAVTKAEGIPARAVEVTAF